jgi:hypothetical protein
MGAQFLQRNYREHDRRRITRNLVKKSGPRGMSYSVFFGKVSASRTEPFSLIILY